MSAATKRRKELITESQKLRKEVEDMIEDLKTKIQGAELKVDGLRRELEEVEKADKRKVVKAPKEGGKLGVLVGLATTRMDELRTSLERVRTERDESIKRMEELEGLLTTFKDEYNPNFNDEGVKRAVRAWEDYAARGKPLIMNNEAAERDLDEVLKTDGENGINWEEFTATEGSSDVDVRKCYSAVLNSCYSESLTKHSIPI